MGGRRIDILMATRVECLLAEGLSYRAIARLVGISRGSVGEIANGRCRPTVNGADSNGGIVYPDKRRAAVKCPAGHGMVHPPCLVCQLIAIAQQTGKRI